MPVKTIPTPGVKVTPLLPIPENLPVWGEHNLDGISQGNIKFDKDTDVAPPLYAGAVAEKGNSRLVVFGAIQSFFDEIVTMRDPEMARTIASNGQRLAVENYSFERLIREVDALYTELLERHEGRR